MVFGFPRIKNVGNLEKERESWLATSTCFSPDSAAGAALDPILSSQFAECDQDLFAYLPVPGRLGVSLTCSLT